MAGVKCNIDRAGRRFRTTAGIVVLLVAFVWFIFTVTTGSALLYALQALLALCGAFSLFQGLVGWCAIRAMGVKTPF